MLGTTPYLGQFSHYCPVFFFDAPVIRVYGCLDVFKCFHIYLFIYICVYFPLLFTQPSLGLICGTNGCYLSLSPPDPYWPASLPWTDQQSVPAGVLPDWPAPDGVRHPDLRRCLGHRPRPPSGNSSTAVINLFFFFFGYKKKSLKRCKRVSLILESNSKDTRVTFFSLPPS